MSAPSDAPATRVRVPRIWVTALAALYLPALLPLAGVGPLTECPHCVRIYLFWSPALPGALIASPLRTISEWLHIAAALFITATFAWALAHIARRVPRAAGFALLAATAVLAAINALVFAAALRA